MLVLVIAELIARALPIPDGAPPPAGDEILLNGNPWLLWELIPGVHHEKGVTVHVNRLGFRGPEPGPKTGERWAAVGDSSVYGFGVEDDEVFTAKLPVETLDFAVPGWSTFQVLNQLRMRGLALEPDALLIATLWSDNNFDSFVDEDLIAAYAGWTGTAAARATLLRSALFRGLDWLIRVRPQAEHARKVGWQVGDVEPKIGKRRVAINDYAANLDTLCRIAPRAVFVMLPNREDLSPRTASPGWNAYRDVMRDAAARCDVPLVDLPKVFSWSGRTADALFLDEMHPTAAGHALIAQAIAGVTPRAARDPGPRPAWTDSYDGRPVPAPRLDTELIVPVFRGGRIVVEFFDGDRLVAGTSVPGPGPIHVWLPFAATRVRATVDASQDGPGVGDLSGEIPMPSGKLDFSKATFSAR